MAWLGRFWRTLRKRRLDAEISEELEFHLAMRERDHIDAGMDPAEARLAALRRFGNTSLTKERTREMDLVNWMESAFADLSYAARTLRKNPSFSVFAALAMALGIGSTTLIFSLVNSLILQPPPYRDARRLYMVWERIPQENQVSFSTRNFLEWKKRTEVFEQIGAFTGNGFTITGRGEPEFVVGQMVTPSLFTVLGVAPALGRAFLESEGEPGRDHAVVLSHGLWRSKFGSRDDVIGQPVRINGESFTIVGVMPAGFDFPSPDYKLWVPAALSGAIFEQHPDAHFLRVIGRLKPGVTEARLDAEVQALGKHISEADRDPRRTYYSVSLQRVFSGDLRKPLLALLAAVGFLLIIACANVSNLMLARASTRTRELAVRAAIGASRGRLTRQLLTESLLLALIGGAAGQGFAYWGLRLLTLFGAKTIPQLLHAHIDLRVLAFSFVASAFSGVLFGLAPAAFAWRGDPHALKEGSRASAGAGADRARGALVFGEMALASVLLVCSGLMVRSFLALSSVDPGFRAHAVITSEAAMGQDRYPEAANMLNFYRTALDAVRRLPGVDAAAAAVYLPFGGNSWGNGYEVEGHPAPQGITYSAQIRPVSPTYFNSLGIPLIGRDFDERDREHAPGVAIVNQALAQRFWGKDAALGRKIRYDEEWLTVVGVCGNVKHSKLDSPFEPEIYIPYPQLPAGLMKFVGRGFNLLLRSNGGAGNAAPEVRAALRSLDPQMVLRINTLEALVNQSVAQPRFRTWLAIIFSLLALALAGVGLSGVVAYLVTQRYKEIGIRIALGASRAEILKVVVGGGLRLTAAAIAAGLAGAFFVSRYLETLVFGITIHDPLTFACIPVFMILITLVASYLPALRATRVDPLRSLRYE